MDKEFIKDLVQNKASHIAMKKAEIKLTKGGLNAIINYKPDTTKGVLKADTDSLIQRKIVGNTYLWMDSHEDVHAKSVFKKTIKERQNSIFHLHDHEFKITSKVGEPSKVYEDSIKWKDLGVNKEGSTESLFMDSNIIKDYNERIFNDYKEGRIQQHSVGMQYVKLDLAVNDDEYEDAYKLWLDVIDDLGNKEEAEEKGYFWYVTEAKLIEISAVLLGSNSLTPTQETKNEPSNDTQTNIDEAAKLALQEKRELFL